MIKIEDLYKSFGDKKVLRGVNLEVEPGESMVVIGGSGSGKSVLIKHIIGLLKPDSGRVIIKGVDISSLKERELYDVRKTFGMLFQGAALFDSLTVWENVAFTLLRHGKISAEEARNIASAKLRLVGLSGVEDLMPSELSGGMRKRVGLARAIAHEPEVILYDEPTTGLDPIMADAINDLIIELRERLHVTSIAITHDMKSAYKIADRIAMLYEGKIIGVGSPEEIKNTSNPVVRQFITGSAVGPIKIEGVTR
ncbi:Phospholipid ABC transporter ATP-binding protein MlaF [hydrothermal vent metagenome]|uniref:Phospholipid ABC transporter ATP-binding protein MlaF n=1 Tax=hydrothermal vent metagenome TaxID=652676 RepID=A0A3B1CU58_9ZZZZ